MKFLLLCLAFLALLQVTLGEDYDECKLKLADIKVKLEATSHYEGTKKTTDMGGSMDDEMKRDSDAETPTNCYLLEGTLADINCDAHKCISLIIDVVAEFDEVFVGDICAPHFNVHQEDPATYSLISSLRAGLSNCNQCVVSYTKFKKMEEKMKAESCYPTATSYTCDEDCFGPIELYIELREEMLGGICRMYSPGGCGDMGGVTEGDIYDLLNSMGPEISRLDTVNSLCAIGCEKPMIAWYQQWNPLVAKGCISTEDIDLAKDVTFLNTFALDLQCNEKCMTEVDVVVRSYYSHTPSHCRHGLFPIHVSELTNSINADRCKDATDSSLTLKIIARAFFTLCLLSVGVFFIYIFSSMGYNRFVKGKKGWEAIPPIFCCKTCFSRGSHSSKKKTRVDSRDEEEVVLYDADDFDDDGL